MASLSRCQCDGSVSSNAQLQSRPNHLHGEFKSKLRVHAMEEQWRPLMETLMRGELGKALLHIETQGRGAHVGALHSCGERVGSCCWCGVGVAELWRFIPELLAKEVVYLDHLKVCNCLWIETLPTAMQADILTFICIECKRFRSSDVEHLASRLLASERADFWVQRAAEALLRDSIRSQTTRRGFSAAYEATPDFLKELTPGLFPVLPLETEHDDLMPQAVTEVGDQAETAEASEQASALTSQTMQGITTVEQVEKFSTMLSQNSKRMNKLDPDLYDKALVLRETLRCWNSHMDEELVDTQLASFTVASDVSAMLGVVMPYEMADSVTLLLVKKLLGENRGYLWSTGVMDAVIAGKLSNLQSPASRELLVAVQEASKAHSRVFVDAVLVPLMLKDTEMSSFLADVICRVVKDSMPVEILSYLCRELFCQPEFGQRDRGFLLWCEPMVMVVHSMFNHRLQLEAEVFSGLVSALESAALQLGSSLKFANFLLCLMTKHSARLGEKDALKRVVLRTSTFMTKSLVSKLEATD